MPVNCRRKGTKIIGQRKAFYWQKIPESSCARKETVDVGILVTSRDGDRKIKQSIRKTSRSPSRIWKFHLICKMELIVLAKSQMIGLKQIPNFLKQTSYSKFQIPSKRDCGETGLMRRYSTQQMRIRRCSEETQE